MKKILFYLIVILLFSGFISNNNLNFKITRSPYKTLSPFVIHLLQTDSSQIKERVAQIWEQGKNEGFPIIEKDSLYEDYVYLTLLFRDSTEDKDITFKMFGIYDEYRFGDMKMHRLDPTDLYYRSYMLPNDLCFSYRFNVLDTMTGESENFSDPFNDNRIPKGEIKQSTWSAMDLRMDETDWNEAQYSNLNSVMDAFLFESKILENERKIQVYLPPDYNEEASYPTIYLFDAHVYLTRVEVPNILDNMITEGQIEPMIAVMISNPTSSSRYQELPLNFEFKDFMVTELIPHIRSKYSTSTLPKDNYIGGISYGGLASTFIAYYHPDICGKVLSQSASYWRGLKLDDQFGNELRMDWLIDKINREKKKDIKFFLDWGLQENMVLGSNRKFAEILHKKGYDFKFEEFNGWHDWSNSRKTFPRGLRYLLKD